MADYVPHIDGYAFTRVAGGAITAGALCYANDSNEVSVTSASTGLWVGVAGFDAAEGDDVTIYCGGVQKLVASTTITAGVQVVPAADGEVAPLAVAATDTAADINSARSVVGVALNDGTDGTVVLVQMAR